MQNSIRAALCAALVGLLTACGGGGGGGGGGFPLLTTGTESTAGTTTPTTPTDPGTTTPPAATSAMLSGKVSTAAGAPVDGFTVSAGGQSATTGADGSYSLNIASPGASTVLLAAKSGYQTMAKEVGLVAGLATTQNITAYPEGVRTTFAATAGKVVIVNGAVIDIPANAIKDAAGNPYVGIVTISASYNNPTTAAGNDAFPQPYAGLDGSNVVTLQSLGVIEAKLFAADGSSLQLSLPATLVYPGVDAISTAATIPIWYYDEAKMTWVHEGDATRNARDGSYSAKVSHFTQWNLDLAFGAGYSSASIEACVNFAGGEASRHGITTTLSGPGFSRSLYAQPLSSGSFDLLRVPVSQPLTLTFTDGSGAAPVAVSVPPIADGAKVILPCVTLTGTSTPVPPTPPSPPIPAPANTPSTAFDGFYYLQFGTLDDSATADWGTFNMILTNGRFAGSDGDGKVSLPGEAVSVLTVTEAQVAVGGYITITGTGSPRGPLAFTGRFVSYVEIPGQFSPEGTWLYATPPAAGQPAQSYFQQQRPPA